MTQSVSRRSVLAIRVVWPVSADVLERLQAGDLAALDCNEGLAGLYAILDDANPLGDFGNYQAVAAVTPGWELFRPGADAKPTRGLVGEREISPSLMVTIHIPGDTSREESDAAIARILAAHPWETPIVEVSETTLAVRAPV